MKISEDYKFTVVYNVLEEKSYDEDLYFII